MFWLIAHAHAFVIPCDPGLTPGAALPAAGATASAEARPAVVFNDGGCDGITEGWGARLLDEAGEVVPTTLGDGSDDVAATWLIELSPDAPLTSDARYTLEVLVGGTPHASSAFDTSDEALHGFEGAPVLLVDSLGWDKRTGTLSAGVTLTPAADPDGLSVLQVRDSVVDRGIQTFVAPAESALSTSLSWLDASKPEEACLQVRQIDGAGRATDWSDPVCERPGIGCATVEGGPALGAALLALGLAAARRRGTATASPHAATPRLRASRRSAPCPSP